MKTLQTGTSTPEEIISTTVRTLQEGGLVVFPSDTVYGLLVDATNKEAVEKLMRFKDRPKGKAISIFVQDLTMLGDVVEVTSDQEKKLAELLPGPFTVVLKSRHQTEKLLESEDATLGVRYPDHRLIQELVRRFGKPVTATSANISGTSSHYSVGPLLKTLSDKKKDLIDLVVDGGTLPRNKPSTVLDMTTADLAVLREGEVVSQQKYISRSVDETKKIADKLVKKIYASEQKKAVVLIIRGDLGAGKTVFVKGVGEAFGITNIVSPTYVVMYEYEIAANKHVEKLAHYDLYNVSDSSEFAHLGFEDYLHPKNLLCIEWGERAGEIADLLKKHSSLIYVYIRHVDNDTREISIRI